MANLTSTYPVTLEDYAGTMHLDPCTLAGVDQDIGNEGRCKALSCTKRGYLYDDVMYALTRMKDAAIEMGGHLVQTPGKLTSQKPYFKKGDYRIGTLLERRVSNVPVTYAVTPPGLDFPELDPNNLSCKVLATPAQLMMGGFALCEVIEKIEIAVDNCVCKRLAVKWCKQDIVNTIPATATTNGTFTVDLAAPAFNFYADDGETRITSVNLIVTTFTPSKPRRRYIECGCVTPGSTCAICNGAAFCNMCLVETQHLWEAQNESACGCPPCGFSGGRHLYYEIDVVYNGVWDAAMLDALVSISNYRRTLAECSACDSEAQARLQRDLGILELSQTDLRAQNNYFVWNNGFGIFTPGAKVAWETMCLRFGVAGMSGAFVI